MINKIKNPKDISDTELHKWIAVHNHDPDATDYITVIEELVRRHGAPVRRRLWIALTLSAISIAVTIFVIIVTYQ